MKREFSAGGIVFNDKGEVLLIQNSSPSSPDVKHWGFPKGHLDEGESSKEAAIREIKEETGVEAKLQEKLGDSKYVFTFKGEKIFKAVAMFKMKHLSGEPTPQEGEIIQTGWYPPEEALKKLSFKNDKDLLQKALQLA